MAAAVFVVPGSLDTRTGGYAYDRRMVHGLRALGWDIAVRELGPSFPHPTPAARQAASRVLAAVPDDTVVIIDGLAFGALPEHAHQEAARLRLVALVHHPLALETGLDDATAAMLESSERRALEAARLIVVTSRATARALPAYGVARARVCVVEPGTDPAPLAHGSAATGAATLELLCVATLTPRKGHDVLVRALARLTHLDWHLTCLGSLSMDRDTTARLGAQLREEGLSERVTLAGEGDESAVAAHYDRADVFVLPTHYEGYGMVVAEALARGLPVVSTPTGAIDTLVGADAGILVPPGNDEALAAALSQIIGDADVRMRLTQGARVARARLPTWADAGARMAHALEHVASDGHFLR